MSVTKTTKDASCIAISLLLIGCGGGGGGGVQNPSNPTPIPTTTKPVISTPVVTTPEPTKPTNPTVDTPEPKKPITTPEKEKPVIPVIDTSKPTTPEKPIKPVINPSDFVRPTFDSQDPIGMKKTHESGITGKGVRVGIIDTDFLAGNSEFDDRLQLIGSGNGNHHGTHVAEVLGGKTSGVAPDVSMVGLANGRGEGMKVELRSHDFMLPNFPKIVNLSIGDGEIVKGGPARAGTRTYQSLVDFGALLVWATGNEDRLNPTEEAGMPLNSPGLEKGWLAVTSADVHGAGFQHAVKPGYANRCGDAANWCLAAPGQFTSAVTGKFGNGTSFAAPAVTAAAALVKQAHPWMTGDMLRQTILSTATNMGEPETYGWGLLNVSEAVKGPALFAKRLALDENVTAFVNKGQDSTFSNNIKGNAGLIKMGEGTLTLSGKNTYEGRTQVDYGVLNITGTISSNVNVTKKGTLRGANGRVGSVINNGNVQVADRGLIIAGDYSSEKSTLVKQINSPLDIHGAATLGPESQLIVTRHKDNTSFDYISTEGNTNLMLSARGGVIGEFSDLAFKKDGSDVLEKAPNLLSNSELLHNSHDVKLKTYRNNIEVVAAEAFADDATRLNSAENLEKVLKVADDLVATGQTSGENAVFLMNAAALQQTENLAAAADVFDSLSGQIHSSAQALTFQQSQSVNRDLSNRLAQLGSNATAKTGLWSSVIASSGKLKQHGYASANTTLSGGQFGIDTRLNDKTIVGAALAYSDSTASFNRFGGQSKSQNIGVSLYGRHAFEVGGVNAYVSGRGGIATVDSNVSRTAIVGSKAVNLNAKHTDQVLSAYLETGYDHPLTSNTSMTPFAGLSYDRVKRGDFNESGNTFGLSANSQSYQQSAGLLGVRANSQFNWSGGKSNVQMYAAWQHTFDGGNLDFSANYNGVAGTQLSVKGIGLPRNTGWVGIGVATDVSKRWGWFANYDAQFGQAGKLNNVVSAGIRIHLD
ncbi:autotransporter domain-containing protein [Glaciimonas sp. GG7]